MKRILLASLVALLVLTNLAPGSAQESIGGLPPSFTQKIQQTDFMVKDLPAPDLIALSQEDALRTKNGYPYRIAVSVPAYLDMNNSGTWTTCEDKGRIWRLKIQSAGAQALGVYYQMFYIPKGSRLFIYTADHSKVLGAYTSFNNPASGTFATELLKGDEIILEYYEPYRRIADEARIEISEIAYVYRDANFFDPSKDFGDSESCEINVNCSEGTSWQNQKRGVARILTKAGSNYYWCTGSLVNNVNNDCTPYFLTADHCGNTSSTADLTQWLFYFNYEGAACTDPATEPTANTKTGCVLKANGGNGGASGSDFYLVQISSAILNSWNVYYNGWNKSTTAATSGVSIHHPSGDIKKISTYTTTLVSDDWNSSGILSHWRVTWATTANGTGVTEGGSSGSPIFNSAGLIVGDLTGGGSYCTAPTQPDYYGKFSYSWESNGSTAATRLRDWLDPANTNPTTLAGRGPCTTSAPVADFSANNTTITVGGSVNFTDLSTNSPTSWAWTFTGGTPGTSAAQNPLNVVYNAAGDYTVTLTATNAYGSDGETKSAYIHVVTGGTGACDTLGLPLTGTPTLYSVTTGYACGNNGYGDLAKAEYFNSYSPNVTVNGVMYWFGFGKGTTGNAQAAVWNHTGSAPGTTFGTANVSVTSIVSDVTNNYYTYVPFAAPVTIPGPFYAGIILPTITGDTIALVSNADGESVPSNAWEMWDDGVWHSFTTAYSGNLDIRMAIFPHVCQSITSTETYTLQAEQVQIFPNPATNKVFISFGDQLLTKIDVKVMNILGEQVMETLYTDVASNMMELDVTGLTPGTYFLKIVSGEQIIVKSVIITE